MEEEELDNCYKPNLVCTILMFISYLILYSISMIVCELYPDIYNNPFLFIMIKYVFGTTHHSIVPLVIMVTRPELRDLIKVPFTIIITNLSIYLDRLFSRKVEVLKANLRT